MPYRFSSSAEDQVVEILATSAANYGREAAERYKTLILTAAEAIGGDPMLAGSASVGTLVSARIYPIRLSRLRVPSPSRVGAPRHMIIYRIASDSVVDVMGLVHDRMDLTRAVRSIMHRSDYD